MASLLGAKIVTSDNFEKSSIISAVSIKSINLVRFLDDNTSIRGIAGKKNTMVLSFFEANPSLMILICQFYKSIALIPTK